MKIRQRQKESIEAAKAKRKHLGRPQINLKTLDKEQIKLYTIEEYQVIVGKENAIATL